MSSLNPGMKSRALKVFKKEGLEMHTKPLLHAFFFSMEKAIRKRDQSKKKTLFRIQDNETNTTSIYVIREYYAVCQTDDTSVKVSHTK